MKLRLPKLLLSVILSQFFTSYTINAASATSIFVQGVSQTESFYDVNKNFQNDSLMCWAATASNVIRKWQDKYLVFYEGENLPQGYVSGKSPSGQNYISTRNCQVFEEFVKDWKNVGGNAFIGYQWWMTGNASYRYEDLEIQNSGGYWTSYFTDSGVIQRNNYFENDSLTGTNYNSATLATHLADIFSQTETAVGLSITSGGNLGHSITLWGYETNDLGQLSHIYITDSDDYAYGMLKISITQKGNNFYLDGYADNNYYIRSFDILHTPDLLKNMLVSYYSDTLTWSGNSKDLKWGTSLESTTVAVDSDGWTATANSKEWAARFTEGRSVEFTDVSNGSVFITGSVSPKSIIVNNSTSHNYTFEGTGEINGVNIDFTKSGKGDLTIKNANSYTGTTSIQGGSIIVKNNQALGNSLVVLTSGGMLDMYGKGEVGTLTINGDFMWNGTVNFTLNSLSLFDTIQVNGKVSLGQDAGISFDGNLNEGTYTLLNSTETINSSVLAAYWSGVTLSDYQYWFQLGNDNHSLLFSLSTELPDLTADDIYWKVGEKINNVEYSDGQDVTFDSTYKRVYISNLLQPGSVTFNNEKDIELFGHGCISGSSSLIKTGQGALILSVSNLYTGGTQLIAGELILSNGLALGTGSVSQSGGILNLGDNVVLNDINTSSGILKNAQNYEGHLSISGEVFVEGKANASQVTLTSGTLNIDNELTISDSIKVSSGNIVGRLSGSGELIKEGDGTLSLSSASSYTGGTVIKGGTVIILADQSLGLGEIVFMSGQLDLNGHQLTNDLFIKSSTTLKGAVNLGNLSVEDCELGFSNSEILTCQDVFLSQGTIKKGITINAHSYQFSSGSVESVLMGDGNLVKDSEGKVTISGDNLFTGGTLITGGELNIINKLGLGTGSVTLEAGTINLNNLNITNDITINGYSQILQGIGYQGAITMVSGTLSGDMLQLSGDNDVRSGTIVSVLSGTGKINKTTSGTLTLSSQNNYTGGTFIYDGLVVVKAEGALGQGDVSLMGGALDLDSHSFDHNIYVLGNSVIKNAQLYTGDLALINSTLTVYGTMSISDLELNEGSLLGGTVSAERIMASSGTITSNLQGELLLDKITSGTLLLSGKNSFTGQINVTNGVIQAGGIKAFSNSTLTLTGSSKIDFDNYAVTNTINVIDGSFTRATNFAGNIYVDGKLTLMGETKFNSCILNEGSINGQNLSGNRLIVYSGIVNSNFVGTGSLDKNSDDRVILNGSNTYTGKTSVNRGILEVVGSITNSTITVKDSASLVLSPFGSITSDIILESKAQLELEKSLQLISGQTLTAGSETFHSDILGNIVVNNNATLGTNNICTIEGNLTLEGGSLSFHMDDTLVISGSMSLNSLSYIDLIGKWEEGEYILAQFGTLTGSSDLLEVSLSGCFQQFSDYHLSFVGNTLVLSLDGIGEIDSVTRDNALLKWVGQYDTRRGIWKTNGNSDLWSISKKGADNRYKNGDKVVFDKTAYVTISNSVSPELVTVSAGQDVTFSGTGGIAGVGSLVKSGKGILTIKTSNSYSGGSFIKGGSVVVGSNTAFGRGDVTLSSGMIDLGQYQLGNKFLVTGTSNLMATGAHIDSLGVASNLTIEGELDVSNLVLSKGSLLGKSSESIIHAERSWVESGTINVSLGGTGSFVKSGKGSLTIKTESQNTYTGLTEFQGGSVTIYGSILNSNVEVSDGVKLTLTGGVIDGDSVILGNKTKLSMTKEASIGGQVQISDYASISLSHSYLKQGICIGNFSQISQSSGIINGEIVTGDFAKVSLKGEVLGGGKFGNYVSVSGSGNLTGNFSFGEGSKVSLSGKTLIVGDITVGNYSSLKMSYGLEGNLLTGTGSSVSLSNKYATITGDVRLSDCNSSTLATSIAGDLIVGNSGKTTVSGMVLGDVILGSGTQFKMSNSLQGDFSALDDNVISFSNKKATIEGSVTLGDRNSSTLSTTISGNLTVGNEGKTTISAQVLGNVFVGSHAQVTTDGLFGNSWIMGDNSSLKLSKSFSLREEQIFQSSYWASPYDVKGKFIYGITGNISLDGGTWNLSGSQQMMETGLKGNLTLNSGSILMDSQNERHDSLTMSGKLTLNGATSLSLSGHWNAGSYTLINFGSCKLMADNLLSLSGLESSDYDFVWEKKSLILTLHKDFISEINSDDNSTSDNQVIDSSLIAEENTEGAFDEIPSQASSTITKEDGGEIVAVDDEALKNILNSLTSGMTLNQDSLNALGGSSLWTSADSVVAFTQGIRQRDVAMSDKIRYSDCFYQSYWVSSLNRFTHQNSVHGNTGYDFQTYGYAIGIDMLTNGNQDLGVALGQTWGKNSLDQQSGHYDQNMTLFSLYSDVLVYKEAENTINISYIMNYGVTSQSGNVSEGYSARWNGEARGLDLSTEWSHYCDDKTTLQMGIGLQYTNTSQDAFALSHDVARYSDSELYRLRLPVHFKIKHRREAFQGQYITLFGQLSVAPELVRKESNPIIHVGDSVWESHPTTPGRTVYAISVGGAYEFNKVWTLSVSYQSDFTRRSSNQSVNASISHKF